jgi:hypothetical protein
MYFCKDVDLMGWEPGIFGEAAFAHQALVKNAAGTIAGTALTMGSAVLGSVAAGMVAAGMVAAVALSDDSLVQLLEVVSVGDASHAVVSALRGRSAEPAVVALVGGSVKVTVMSFVPQIAAVGDELLAAIGVASDRDTEPEFETRDLRGFREACVVGVLAMVFRTLSTDAGATAAMLAKRDFYAGAYAAAKRGIAGRVEGREVRGGVGEMVRA